MNGRHLVFYDGNCGFCQWSVRWLLNRDKEKQFLFAPLQGETAKEKLVELLREEPNLDSMVLIEDFRENSQPLVRAKAVLRSCWLLGGAWRLLGWMYIFPAWLMDWVYNLVARHRHKLGIQLDSSCPLPPPDERDRFLS